MANYREEVTKVLGDHCVNELRDAVERNQVKQKDFLELALQTSRKIHGHVERSIEEKGYGRWTVDVFLDKWYERKPSEVNAFRIVEILRSPNIRNNALANEIEIGQQKAGKSFSTKHSSEDKTKNDSMDSDQPESQAKFSRDGILRQSKRFLKKAQQEREEANKSEDRARNEKEEARKEKEEVQRAERNSRKEKAASQKLLDGINDAFKSLAIKKTSSKKQVKSSVN